MALDRKQLEKPSKRLRKILTKFPKQPSPATVHNLRTQTRRLEATFEALGLDGREGKLLNAIKPVRSRAGKVRDMDVLTGFACTLHAKGEDECHIQLLEHLGHERYRHARKLNRKVSTARSKLRKALKQSRRRVDRIWKSAHSDTDSDRQRAPIDAVALSLQLSSDLRRPARLDAHNLHPYRLKVKKLRYLLQLAKNPDRGFVDALGEVKDAIGEWHDWQELAVLAENELDHGSRCKLVGEIHTVGRAKFEHALSLANALRRNYATQSARHRDGGSRSKQKPKALSRPVLVASSALAA